MIKVKQSIFLIVVVLTSLVLMTWLYSERSISNLETSEAEALHEYDSTNSDLPTCEELNIPQSEIDVAIAESIAGIENPWGDESDFLMLMARVEKRLNCRIEIDISTR